MSTSGNPVKSYFNGNLSLQDKMLPVIDCTLLLMSHIQLFNKVALKKSLIQHYYPNLFLILKNMLEKEETAVRQ